MQLKKILEEINYRINEYVDHDYVRGSGDVVKGLSIAKSIVRKHINDGWIPVEERLPEPGRIVLITQTYSWENFEEGASVTIGRLSPEKNNKMWEFQYYRPDFRSGTIMDNDIICPGSEYVIAWCPLPEPYRPERCGEE